MGFYQFLSCITLVLHYWIYAVIFFIRIFFVLWSGKVEEFRFIFVKV
jgi:hypothetical protein